MQTPQDKLLDPDNELLDWPDQTVRRVPNRNISPLKSSSKNTWDHEHNEFTDWSATYRSKYGTFKSSKSPNKLGQRSMTTTTFSISHDGISRLDDDGFSKEEKLRSIEESRRDMIEELCDPAWSNPTEPDLHDQVMQQFVISNYKILPGDYPVRHMHVLAYLRYRESSDTVVQTAMPRLCDGVATVLFETSPQCLDDFLDPKVKLFEWGCHASQSSSSSSVVIRREGNEVITGIYRNHGFQYLWNHFIKCHIHFTGKWSEVFASSRGTTMLSEAGPAWAEFKPLDSNEDSENTQYALYFGRQLARHYLMREIWKTWGEAGRQVMWEADGKVVKKERCPDWDDEEG